MLVEILMNIRNKTLNTQRAMESDQWIKNIAMDATLIEKLAGGIIDVNEASHPFGENSIEVQMPFLQYIGSEKEFSVALISQAITIEHLVPFIETSSTFIAKSAFSEVRYNCSFLESLIVAMD